MTEVNCWWLVFVHQFLVQVYYCILGIINLLAFWSTVDRLNQHSNLRLKHEPPQLRNAHGSSLKSSTPKALRVPLLLDLISLGWTMVVLGIACAAFLHSFPVKHTTPSGGRSLVLLPGMLSRLVGTRPPGTSVHQRTLGSEWQTPGSHQSNIASPNSPRKGGPKSPTSIDIEEHPNS